MSETGGFSPCSGGESRSIAGTNSPNTDSKAIWRVGETSENEPGDIFDSTEPIQPKPTEWTDWRETPAVRHDRDKAALRRVLDELEGFLADAPADDPAVVSLLADLARCRNFLDLGKPIVLSEGVLR